MKTIKNTKIKVLTLLTLMVVLFSSCLKDPRYIDYASSPPLVEFPLASYNANKTTVIGPAPNAVVASAGTFNLPVTVNLASANTLGQDVTFTVAVDNSVLTGAPSTTKASAVTPSSLTANIPQYAPLPSTMYTLVNASGTIPAGQRTAVVTVQLNGPLIGSVTTASNIKNYAIRLVIKTASVQISNYNVQTYLIQLQ